MRHAGAAFPGARRVLRPPARPPRTHCLPAGEMLRPQPNGIPKSPRCHRDKEVQVLNSPVATARAALAPLSAKARATPGADPDSGAIERIVRDHLLADPGVIGEAIRPPGAKRQEGERERAEAAVARNGEALHAHPLALVPGTAGGDVTEVEFFDCRCGSCTRASPAVTALPQEDPNVRVFRKEFPIPGPVPDFAARAAMAADRQGRSCPLHLAWMKEPELTDAQVLEHATTTGLDAPGLRQDMVDPGIRACLEETRAPAQKTGISSAPDFAAGRTPVPGVEDAARMKALVAAARGRRQG